MNKHAVLSELQLIWMRVLIRIHQSWIYCITSVLLQL